MFVGHYGVSFAAKRVAPTIPLWVLFLAVQLLDVLWAPFVMVGLEKVAIVPGITASNPLDLYYMPYSHSLIAATFWSLVGGLVWAIFAGRGRRASGALVVGLAVLSHWVLDAIVHRPDLPLYDNAAKVGLGLWNYPVLAFLLESALMIGGLLVYLRATGARAGPWIVFAGALLAVHTIAFFGAPPTSAMMAAWMALLSYLVLAAAAGWLEHRARGATATS